MASFVGASSHGLKGCGFDSWSRHILRLWVQSPVGVWAAGNQSMFLSCIDVALSLPPLPLSLKSNENMSSGEEF